MATIREKFAKVTKGVFASGDGSALVSLPMNAEQVTDAVPISDLTPYLSAMPGLSPVGPEDYQIRSRDFMIGENLNVTPGGGKFPILRAFADKWNVLRTIIDTKKDLMSAVPWSIKPDPKPGESKKDTQERALGDPIVQKLTEFFQSPDGEHTWNQWIHLALEETYVIDALCIQPVREKDKDAIAKLVIVSGDVINRQIDDRGWTPGQDKDGKWQTAYQQVLMGGGNGSGGVNQRDLTMRELIYAMRNPRVNRKWGQSSVEKIYTYAMTGICADAFILNYYTQGNQPPGIAFISDMTPAQVEELAGRFNAMYKGDLEQRRDIAFLPAGPGGKSVQFVPTKEPLLKPDIYDQLVRFACAEFSVPSVPFEKPMNRASAQEAGEQAQVAGLEPDIEWFQELMNRIIKNKMYFGLSGYSFVFGPRRDVDAKTQMEVDTGYAKCAILTVDEIRDELGKEPFKDVPEASKPGVMTPNNGFIPLSSADAAPILAARQKQNTPPAGEEEESETPDKPETPAKKAAKKMLAEKAAKIQADRLTSVSKHSEQHMGATLEAALKKMRTKALDRIREAKSQ
jgi:hypothetical protein